MAGCYGNSPEDQYYERMLNKYLDETYGDGPEDNDPDDEADFREDEEGVDEE